MKNILRQIFAIGLSVPCKYVHINMHLWRRLGIVQASLASALALRKRFSCLKLHPVLAYYAKQSLQIGGGKF